MKCSHTFCTRDGSTTTINCACFDAQAVNSENEEEEVIKDDEKGDKKKKRVRFALPR
jgi:hypothetical protein